MLTWFLPLIACLPLVALAIGRTQALRTLVALQLGAMALFAGMGIGVWVEGPFVGSMWALQRLNSIVLVLVGFVGWVVVRYASENFFRDPDGLRFLKPLVLTLAALQVTLCANHLAVLWIGWLAVSLSLHRLLVFFPHRYRAILGAHKKFIAARIAEVLLGFSFLGLYASAGTAQINVLVSNGQWADSGMLTFSMCLLAVVGLLKCAQMPFHGWLIQVVESPTPVSALLHAGIVNFGGYLILLFAPLFGQVMWARSLLLVFAGLSVLISGWVAFTRVSIKVRLAWSTVTQMGFMLIECGLGLYELALLHLVAHAGYKAHAFLTAGRVDRLPLQVADNTMEPSRRHYLQAAAWVIAGLGVTAWLVPVPKPIAPWFLLGLASLFVLARFGAAGLWQRGILVLTGGWFLYGTQKEFFAVAFSSDLVAYSALADVWVIVLTALLALGPWVLNAVQGKPWGRSLWVALNAGLYLDAWANRLTLLLWPVVLNPKPQQSLSHQKEVLS
ncbi:MAG: NADH-quinone oxidoreductase subunit L [Acidobacteria bacterium]|nr:NADH-quinone oxidoreductase subunit L [Acidobacteriota bacterium]MCB9396605.1 NADH-quinone oxidoreductase subunit L [Acidobacteriota bacterium]